MSTNNVNLTSIEDILVYARKALNEMELVKFETFYRQLKQQIPGHPVIGEVKNLTSSFLQARFAEFLSGGHGQSAHLNSYMAGWIKKLDITKDIQGFSEIARRVLAQQRTLLYFDRLYTLFQVMENTSKSAGDIVELGVYRGGSLRFICEVADHLKISPNIYGLDTFSGHAGVSAEDSSQAEGQFSNTSLGEVSKYLADCSAVKLVPGDVRETLQGVLDGVECLAMAHLDLDLHEPTAQAFRLIEPKLVVGGAIIVDDYGFLSCKGVRKATDEFAAKSGLKKFHLMTGQCLLLK